jgi:hypothetical protein
MNWDFCLSNLAIGSSSNAVSMGNTIVIISILKLEQRLIFQLDFIVCLGFWSWLPRSFPPTPWMKSSIKGLLSECWLSADDMVVALLQDLSHSCRNGNGQMMQVFLQSSTQRTAATVTLITLYPISGI